MINIENTNELNNNELFWAKVRPDAIIPSKEDEDAGYDIYANFESDLMVFAPGETRLVPTGIASAVSNNYYIQVEERGSTGSKGIKKSAGIIDSGYRGEIFIAITNCNTVPLIITNCNIEDLQTNSYKRDLSQNVDEFEKLHKAIYKLSNSSIFQDPYISDCIIYPKNKAIAQLIVHRVEKMNEKEISYEELQRIPSKRGAGMLGSSGK